MNKHGKRIVAVFLTAIMLFTALPSGALAALVDNDPAYNREILNALTDMAGSEKEAEVYYDVMQQYGLLDEDGNAVENWTITMDGKDITLDELREVLAGDYDPEKYLCVDGTFVTLADVKTMLEIEDYISYIRDTYYSDGEWTKEQVENYQSLIQQVQTKGITLRGASSSMVGPSGVNHAARVSVSFNSVTNNRVTYDVALSDAAENQTVTFRVKGASGSCNVTNVTVRSSLGNTTNGTVKLTSAVPTAQVGFFTDTSGVYDSSNIYFYAIFDEI